MRIAFGLFLLAWLAATSFVWFRSESELERTYPVEASALRLSVETGPARVARGRHVAITIAQCQFCHGNDLAGRLIADDAWIGRLAAPNLTAGKGGIGKHYRVEDWVRAIRYGVAPDGRSLLLMPSVYLAELTDADLAAVISFLMQIPSVDRGHAVERRVGWLTRAALSVGAAADLMSAAEVVARPAGAARAETSLGDYLLAIGNCRICHHADLRGGLQPLALPGEPPPSDLRPGGAMAGWTRADFERAMRSGRTPDGRQLDREFMPWPAYAGLGDDELAALWEALSNPIGRDKAAGSEAPH